MNYLPRSHGDSDPAPAVGAGGIKKLCDSASPPAPLHRGWCVASIIPLDSGNYFANTPNNQYTPAANNPLAGIVISHEVTISSATLQRTLLTRSEVPTPIIAELTTCEVLTGTPKREATNITIADENCVDKLCRGRILYMRAPSVRINRQPPRLAPRAITAALKTTTQFGT